MSHYSAKRQVKAALGTRNGHDVLKIKTAPLGSKVLVSRTKSNAREGPFTLLHVIGETCALQFPDGPKQFRTTVVKTFKEDLKEELKPALGMKIEIYWPQEILLRRISRHR